MRVGVDMSIAIKVYLDSCCYSRLFDIITHAKVKAEADKIQDIINNRFLGHYVIIGSLIVIAEIRKIPNILMRKTVEGLYSDIITDEVKLSAQNLARAHKLHLGGLGKMDARHLTAAEVAEADFLLTTDMDFIKVCAKPNFTTVNVINPIDF